MYTSSDKSRVIPFSKKQQPSSILKRLPKLQMLIIFSCMVWAGYTYIFVQLPNMHKLDGQRLKLNQQLTDLKQKNSQLQETIKQLNSDAYISELARTKYNMKKPGDVILSP